MENKSPLQLHHVHEFKDIYTSVSSPLLQCLSPNTLRIKYYSLSKVNGEQWEEVKILLREMEEELAEKDKNLKIAAELGQMLIEKNESLEASIELKEKEISECQAKHVSEKRIMEQKIKRFESEISELEKDVAEKLVILSQTKADQQSLIQELGLVRRRLNDFDTTGITPATNRYRRTLSQTSVNSDFQVNKNLELSSIKNSYLTPGRVRIGSAMSPISPLTPQPSNSKSTLSKVNVSAVSKRRIFYSYLSAFRRQKQEAPIVKKEFKDFSCDARKPPVFSVSSITHHTFAPNQNSVEISNSDSNRADFLEKEYAALAAILETTRAELEGYKNLEISSYSKDRTFSENNLPKHITLQPSLMDELSENSKVLPDQNITKDAHLEYFFLAVLSVKLCNTQYMEALHSVNPLDLWNQAVKENVSFKDYHQWIEKSLGRHYYQHSVATFDVSNYDAVFDKKLMFQKLIESQTLELDALKEQLKLYILDLENIKNGKVNAKETIDNSKFSRVRSKSSISSKVVADKSKKSSILSFFEDLF